jgi:nucleoside-diphosphate-sugar epimerase
MSQYHVPYSINAEFSPVDLLDVAEVAAIVLTSSDHDDAIYELAGPEIYTPKSMAMELGEALGKLAMAVQIDRAEWAKRDDLESGRKDLLLRMFEYYDEHGLRGNSRVLADLLGREPTTFRQFANRLVQEAADL